MIDTEKIINALDNCVQYMGDCINCEYLKHTACKTSLMIDALAALKEQKAKLVEIDGQLGGIKYGRCPKCGKGLNEEVYPHWCGFCGQAVKWNG